MGGWRWGSWDSSAVGVVGVGCDRHFLLWFWFASVMIFVQIVLVVGVCFVVLYDMTE